MSEFTEKFKRDGYCVVQNAVSPDVVSFITQYAMFDEMQDFNTSEQVPNAHAKYADPAMETLMLHMHPQLEEITGLKLHPTYSFFRVYRNGHELTKHTDRPSCEISTTISFKYNYDSDKFQWPIYMAGNEVNLNPGDMVVYRGMELEHWRNPLVYDEPVWHVQAFLHYVDANGPNADWKYDRRKTPGRLERE